MASAQDLVWKIFLIFKLFLNVICCLKFLNFLLKIYSTDFKKGLAKNHSKLNSDTK